MLRIPVKELDRSMLAPSYFQLRMFEDCDAGPTLGLEEFLRRYFTRALVSLVTNREFEERCTAIKAKSPSVLILFLPYLESAYGPR